MEAETNPPRSSPSLWLLLLFAWAGTMLCLLLWRQHPIGLCGMGSGCERVLTSRYSEVSGIPLALVGLLYYGGILMLVLMLLATGRRGFIRPIFAGATLAALASVVLLLLQASVIGAYCLLCLISAALCFSILVTAWFLRSQELPPRSPWLAAVLVAAWSISAATAGLPVTGGRGEVVALVDGHEIHRRDLDRVMALTRQDAERQIHAVEMERLDELIDRQLLGREAERRGVAVSRLPGTNELLPRLRDAAHIERRLPPPVPRVIELDARLGHRLGPEDAAVTLTVFSDFECPFCRKLAPVLGEIRESHPNEVALVFRAFPLDDRPRSWPAAVAAECAAKQGKFWPYHDWLFRHGRTLSDEELLAGAVAVGLQAEAFTKCLKGEESLAAVRASERGGTEVGIFGAPMVFLNGRYLPQLDRATLEREVREALREERDR